MMTERSQVIVVGSGAGGATTALTLAEAGVAVTVLEEGPRVAASDYGAASAPAMQRLYRRAGMTPIVGKVPLGFVEGLNNKIRVIQRKAYGFRDEEYLRLKILTCMLPKL